MNITKSLLVLFLLVGIVFIVGCTQPQPQQTCRYIQIPYEEEEVYTVKECEKISFGVRSRGDFDVFKSEDSSIELLEGNTFRVTTTYKSNTNNIFTTSFFPECYDNYGTMIQGNPVTQKFGAYEQIDVSAVINIAGLDGPFNCWVLSSWSNLPICSDVEKTKSVTKYKEERVCG